MRARHALLAMILCVAVASTVPAQEIEWRSDLTAARDESARTGRPLLVVVTAGVWCDPCRWFAESTLNDPDIVRLVDARYVPFLVNDSDTAAAEFVIDRVPSVYLFRPGEDGAAFTTSGAISADALAVHLKRLAPDAVRPVAGGALRYRFNGGDVYRTHGKWRSRDAGLPPEFELYEEDDGFFYLRNTDAAVLLALPRRSGEVWRWDQESREWVSAGEAELLPQ